MWQEGGKRAMKLSMKMMCIGLVALAMLGIGGIALAEGTQAAPGGALLRGRVATKSANGFTLGTGRGDVTVSVGANTRYRVPGKSQPSLDDILVGDQVLVRVQRNAPGSPAATAVVVLPPVPVGGLRGQVTAVQDATISLQVGGQVKAVLTNEKTSFHVPEKEGAKLADIRVGDRVFAIVLRQPGGTLLARQVTVLPADSRGPLSLRGRVIEVGASTLTVHVGENQVTIEVTEQTKVRVPGKPQAALSDVRMGDWVFVVGRPTGLSRIEARAIVVLPAVPVERFAVRGEVISVEGTTLSVRDARHEHTIRTDSQTQFRIGGVENPSIEDVNVGDRVAILGKPAEGGAILARRVVVGRAQQPALAEPDQLGWPESSEL
jgi:preprotein translocase subunit YajC